MILLQNIQGNDLSEYEITKFDCKKYTDDRTNYNIQLLHST